MKKTNKSQLLSFIQDLRQCFSFPLEDGVGMLLLYVSGVFPAGCKSFKVIKGESDREESSPCQRRCRRSCTVLRVCLQRAVAHYHAHIRSAGWLQGFHALRLDAQESKQRIRCLEEAWWAQLKENYVHSLTSCANHCEWHFEEIHRRRERTGESFSLVKATYLQSR